MRKVGMNFLITRSPSWRHERLTKLFHKLDKNYNKYSKSEKSRPLKPRKPGPFSERIQPITAPKWAVAGDINVPMNHQSVSLLKKIFRIRALF